MSCHSGIFLTTKKQQKKTLKVQRNEPDFPRGQLFLPHNGALRTLFVVRKIHHLQIAFCIFVCPLSMKCLHAYSQPKE